MVRNTKNHYEHKIIALDTDGKTIHKPTDVYGKKYAWQVGGENPLWYSARYENTKGEGGPWSPIVEAYIG